MKFNEKEIAYFALTPAPDREGLLEKKGAGLGQGYRQRWFRLKGNLLFYFRVDEFQDWRTSGEPLGVIVLERCTVEDLHSPSQPFMFSLSFADDVSRQYLLRANSLEDQRSWIRAISMASYDSLRVMLYELQKQITSLTGTDPLSSRNLYIPSSASGSTNLLSSNYRPSMSSLNASRLPQRAGSGGLSVTIHKPLPVEAGPVYELRLRCEGLSCSGGDKELCTLVRVLHLSKEDSTHYLPISVTEVVENSSSPTYSHAALLENKLVTGGSGSSAGILVFRVMSVTKIQNPTEDIKTTELGSTKCPVNKLIDVNKETPSELKLKISDGGKDVGCLIITATKMTASAPPLPPKKNAEVTSQVSSTQTTYQPFGLGVDVMHSSVTRRFYFPTSSSTAIRVTQEMGESLFTVQVPLQLLKCFRREDAILLEEFNYSTGALSDNWLSSLQHYQAFLYQTVVAYTDSINTLDELADMFSLKLSTKKAVPSMQPFPTNLHVQKLLVSSQSSPIEKTYHVTMCGCPADYVSSFKNGGLRSLLENSHPSFVTYKRPPSVSTVRRAMETLNTIRTDMDAYKNLLYRGCGNANPSQMTAAFSAMSTEIQKLLALMQSKVVQDAIDELNKARPPPAPTQTIPPPLSPTVSSTPPASPRSSAHITAGSEGASGRDAKRLSRALNIITKCLCGKCSKCVPSPSDWVWNGYKLAQVSSGEWKLEDSIESIQQSLVFLLEAVESATGGIIQQQHDAHAASADNVISTFKPTFVWSEVLIPKCSSLHQTVEGLFKLAYSVLSFALVKLDAKYTCNKLVELRRRWDMVFCEALTILVTSFYATLCQHLQDHSFHKQIEEIGFFVEFEAFLSPLGDEYGVLEDMLVAVSELKNVKFQFAPNSNRAVNFDFHITGTRENLTIQFLFGSTLASLLPRNGLLEGRPVGVVPVLFTQGVNETQQITVDVRHQLLLQDEVNKKGMELITGYTDHYIKLMSQKQAMASQPKLVGEIKELLAQLKEKYDSQKSTGVEFFINLQQLCRKLNGGRIASCVNGKDRTSMSVSLEECCLLRNKHKLKDDHFMKTLEALRSGTHLDNCLKNTGHRKYQFSSHHLKLLPRIMKPPWYLTTHQDQTM